MEKLESKKELLDEVWHSVRGLIAKSLLADCDLVPVPGLSCADDFGLFSVFVKSKSETLSQKIKHSLAGSTYNVIGHISQVIQLEKTDLDRLLDSAKPHVEDIDRSKRWEGDVDLGAKSVHLTVEGLSKFLVPLCLRQGDLYLKVNIPDLIGAKSVYIVTDVLKACNVTAVVTGDDDSWERIPVCSIPIAFGYSKFCLTSDGLVGDQIKCKPSQNGKWEVVIDRLYQYLNVL